MSFIANKIIRNLLDKSSAYIK